MTDSPYTPDNEYAPRADILLFASRSGSSPRGAMARNLETTIRERISRIGQLEVAGMADIDKTKLNRCLSQTAPAGICIHEMYDFMAALGLGVIECDDPEMVSLPRTELEALQTLARKALAQIADPRGTIDEK